MNVFIVNTPQCDPLGRVAQLVERGIENPCVGGSTPSPATFILVALLFVGCGDRCEVLCREVALELEACRSDSLTWADLGATGRADFVAECETDWNLLQGQLSSNELNQALDVCKDTLDELPSISCDELGALYAL